MQKESNPGEYYVDAVICIDGTAGMRDVGELIKQTATGLFSGMTQRLSQKGRILNADEFRVRCVVFRDFSADGGNAMEETPFFHIADAMEAAEFNRFADSVVATGGGDYPENALEALYAAIRSDWNPLGGRCSRQIIVLLTDAPYQPLHDPVCAMAPNYPLDAPETLDGLRSLYEEGAQGLPFVPKKARLLLFVPMDCPEWKRFCAWDRTWIMPTRIDGGCAEVNPAAELQALFSVG